MTESNNGVLVVVEMLDSQPIDLGLEMLGLARRLADSSGGTVTAVAFGTGLETTGEMLTAYGADQVLINDNAIFANFHAEAWLPDLSKIVVEVAPAIVLIGHSLSGTDLAPRLAYRLDVDVATGCESIDIVNGRPHMTRSCFGGLAREVVTFNKTPAVATIRSKTQEPLTPMMERVGEVKHVSSILDVNSIRTRVVNREREKADGVKLESAKIVIGGGLGLGGPEGFNTLHEIAELVGGAVGASRAACDLDWCPRSYQIGLTGRTVAPELYLAVGISGASHHMAGCGNSKTIVSINSDPDAAIFKSSRFGIVGNSQEIMPALVEEIRKLKA
ncbi:MAG: electron transfer flavoprotein alpha subunit [Oceanospirillaceae bacterium]|jgi:electron transfer flavoprotein alpha subunit